VNSPLQQLRNIPVTAAAIESLYPELKGGNQKIRLLERDKQIFRLKRGLYVCSPNVTGVALSTELIANHLYTPSYVSMSSALRYYGLIPEEVFVMQSMTLKHSRDFDTSFGRFEYTYISKDVFPVGLSSINKKEYAFVIATPEKALCDLIANSTGVNLRYPKDAALYLEEDIRMELSDFMQMNPAIFEEYAKVGKKADSIRTLLKLLRRL
jgi:predicted transcriptional regulator of viral defense system